MSLLQKQQPSTTTTMSVQDDVVQSLLKVHHLHGDILNAMGVDACKGYEESIVENVLDRVTEGVKKCAVCRCQGYNTQKLRNHVKIIHLGKTSHECSHCSKYFGGKHSRKCSGQGY